MKIRNGFVSNSSSSSFIVSIKDESKWTKEDITKNNKEVFTKHYGEDADECEYQKELIKKYKDTFLDPASGSISFCFQSKYAICAGVAPAAIAPARHWATCCS